MTSSAESTLARMGSTLLTAFLVFMASVGCPAAPSDTKMAALGENFTLKIGETASITGAGLQVGFAGVSGDSRCPKGEQCLWEGDAVVRVWLQKDGGAREQRDLHTSSRTESSTGNPGYAVRLVHLDPHPVSGRQVAAGDYRATLQVTRD